MYISKISVYDCKNLPHKNRQKVPSFRANGVNFANIPTPIFQEIFAKTDALASDLVSKLFAYNGKNLNDFLKATEPLIQQFKNISNERISLKHSFIKNCLTKSFPKSVNTIKDDYNKKTDILALRFLANLNEGDLEMFLNNKVCDISTALKQAQSLEQENLDKSMFDNISNEIKRIERLLQKQGINKEENYSSADNTINDSVKEKTEQVKSDTYKPTETTTKTGSAQKANGSSVNKITAERVKLAQTFISIPQTLKSLESILENIKITENLGAYISSFSESASKIILSYQNMQNFNDNNFKRIISKITMEDMNTKDSLDVEKLKIKINKTEQDKLFKEFADAVKKLELSNKKYKLYKDSIQKLLQKYNAEKNIDITAINSLENTMNSIIFDANKLKSEYIDKKDFIPYEKIKNVYDAFVNWNKLKSSITDKLNKVIQDYKIIIMAKESYNECIKQLQDKLNKIIKLAADYNKDLDKLKY